jgi:hypothetical protein
MATAKDESAKSKAKAPEMNTVDDTAGGADDVAERQELRRRRDEARATGDTKLADELHAQLYQQN